MLDGKIQPQGDKIPPTMFFFVTAAGRIVFLGAIAAKRVPYSELSFDQHGLLVAQSVRDYFTSLGYKVGLYLRPC